MKQKKINNLIIDYILNNYDKETPIFTKIYIKNIVKLVEVQSALF